MKNIITITTVIAAGTLLADAATLIVLNANSQPSWATDNLLLNNKGTTTFDLRNTSDKITFTASGGNFWGTLSNQDGVASQNWSNTNALSEMTSTLGISQTLQNADINNLLYTATGNNNSKSTVTLNLNSLSAGDQVVFYALITSRANALTNSTNFAATGLSNVTYSYATNTGTGFGSTKTFSNGLKDYSLVKIEGTLESGKSVQLSCDVVKNGWGMIAYSAVPEPSAFGLLAGLGALALVGARRRRR